MFAVLGELGLERPDVPARLSLRQCVRQGTALGVAAVA